MLEIPDLDDLIAALRHAGIRVGYCEMARLQEVFRLQPKLDGDLDSVRQRLRSLIGAAVLRSTADRETFDRVLDAWLESLDLTSFQPTPYSQRSLVAPKAAQPRMTRRVIVAAAMILVAVTAFWLLRQDGFLGPAQPETPTPRPTPTTAVPTPSIDSIELPSPEEYRKRTVTVREPTITVNPGNSVWEGWTPAAIAALSLAMAAALWLGLRRRRYLPEPAPPPDRRGPLRAVLPPPSTHHSLLSKDEQEAIAWGVGHLATDEPTRHLNLPATVNATARDAGIPHLVLQAALHQREVWLWMDEAADNEVLEQQAADIDHALTLEGLPVERAWFYGIPDRLSTAEGATFAPREVEDRRTAALVVILTDGEALVRSHAVDTTRVRVEALLRDLSRWPNIAFVDFSDDQGQLGTLLQRHGLTHLEPEQLTTHLGSGGSRSTRPRPGSFEQHDRLRWAAACCLAPTPPDRATALELRARLGLRCSALAVPQTDRARGQTSETARLLTWLVTAEGTGTDVARSPSSTLSAALDYWEHRYDELLRRVETTTTGAPSAATRFLQMEQALIRLWRAPDQAASELYALFQGHLGPEIQTRLAALAPRDYADPARHAMLPWAWRQRDAASRSMLESMGLGGGMRQVTLRRPGRLWLGLGLCLGCALGGAWAALTAETHESSGAPVVMHTDDVPQDERDRTRFEETAAGRWNLAIPGRRRTAHREVNPGSEVQVAWTTEQQDAVQTIGDGAELWIGEEDARLPGGTLTSLVVLKTVLGNQAAEVLAMTLLESRSADLVLIDPGWPRTRTDILGGFDTLGSKQQMLVITTGRLDDDTRPPGACGMVVESFDDLAGALRFEGTKSIGEALGRLAIQPVDADRCQVNGLQIDGPKERLIDPTTEMRLRLIPRGRFMMGSPTDEPGRDNDETQHEVTISYDFWIGETEVTQGQWQAVMDSNPSTFSKCGAECPVENVSWTKALEFTNRLSAMAGLEQCYDIKGNNDVIITGPECEGYRLPTEAEWEYAARAGTTDPWSFGDTADDIARYAWFNGNSQGITHPVRSKLPNPWGLYDMHGNVWEWCGDWFVDYSTEAQVDPTGPERGTERVLRGGSFFYSARFLRSAYRFRSRPGYRGQDLGFRCARGPRRQH